MNGNNRKKKLGCPVDDCVTLPEGIVSNNLDNNIYYSIKNQESVSATPKQDFNTINKNKMTNMYLKFINVIKKNLGFQHNDFEKYPTEVKEKRIDTEKVFNKFLSDDFLINFLQAESVKKSESNKKKYRIIFHIILLIFMKCTGYKCLSSELLDVYDVSERTIRNWLNDYVPPIKEVNHDLDIIKYMPGATFYTFSKIKGMVEALGKEITGLKGKLVYPENKADFDTLKKKCREIPALVPIRVKCPLCKKEWPTNASMIKKKFWCGVCTRDKAFNLSDEELLSLCVNLIAFIKSKLGLDHDNFGDYFNFVRENNINVERIINSILKKSILKQLLKKSKIKVENRTRRLKQAQHCFIVVTLALLYCDDHENLKESMCTLLNLSSSYVRDIINRYIPVLEKINSDIIIDKWVAIKDISFKRLKRLVEKVSKQKNGVIGYLKTPENKTEWEQMKKRSSVIASRIPIRVKCGHCNYSWKTNASRLYNLQWCFICAQGIYTYPKLEDLVWKMGIKKTGVGGILVKPSNKQEWQTMLENSAKTSSIVEIKVKCGLCGRVWDSNASYVQQEGWCGYCTRLKYQIICRWYFENIFSYCLRSSIEFPETRLEGLIKSYNKDSYTQEELEVVENLIKYGSFDGYTEIVINYKLIKIAFEYDGTYHTKFHSLYHKSISDFLYTKLKDRLKNSLARENNIILIRIPYNAIDYKMKDYKLIQKSIMAEISKRFNLPSIPQFNHNNTDFIQYFKQKAIEKKITDWMD